MAVERYVCCNSQQFQKSHFSYWAWDTVYYLGQVTFTVALISIYKQKLSHPTGITEESFYNFAIKPTEALPLLSPLKMKQPTSVCNGCWRMTTKVQLLLFSCIFLDNQNKSVMVLSQGKPEGTLMRQRSANYTKKRKFLSLLNLFLEEKAAERFWFMLQFFFADKQLQLPLWFNVSVPCVFRKTYKLTLVTSFY